MTRPRILTREWLSPVGYRVRTAAALKDYPRNDAVYRDWLYYVQAVTSSEASILAHNLMETCRDPHTDTDPLAWNGFACGAGEDSRYTFLRCAKEIYCGFVCFPEPELYDVCYLLSAPASLLALLEGRWERALNAGLLSRKGGRLW